MHLALIDLIGVLTVISAPFVFHALLHRSSPKERLAALKCGLEFRRREKQRGFRYLDLDKSAMFHRYNPLP